MDMIGLNGTLKVLCPEFPDPIPDLLPMAPKVKGREGRVGGWWERNTGGAVPRTGVDVLRKKESHGKRKCWGQR